MKRFKKITLLILGMILLFFLGVFVYYLAVTSGVKLNYDKFETASRSITFYDFNGEILSQEISGNEFVSINDTPTHVKNAFIAIEDKRFYTHNGVDKRRLLGAAFNNLKSFSFKEGASTISQQLIKNTHLYNEKTIKRKLLEIKLAKKLEKNFSKDEILETYLNHIYFGENCYGIKSAAKRYFNKEVKDLTVNEGATLAALIKAPSYYSPTINVKKCTERKNLVLKEMKKQNYITENEYNLYIEEEICLSQAPRDTDENEHLRFARTEFFEKVKLNPYQSYDYKIETFYNKNLQEILENCLTNDTENYDKTAILINKNGEILAYYSTNNDERRQVGSTIKPLISYAPAIEENAVDSFTKILDEKTDFNGYSPNNYNDVYYGKISVKDSIAKSSNVCAVKLLNYVTIEKAKSYLKKLNFPLSENDNGLSLALGATEHGAKLLDVTSAYTNFINEGNYITPSTVSKINFNDIAVDEKRDTKTRVFNNDTVSIINDALRNAVTNGTAKKLSFLNFPVYAKTGTVGTAQGNTDAYAISYTEDYVLGVRFSSRNGSLMNNSISGGTAPTLTAKEIWSSIYEKKQKPSEIEKDKNVVEIQIDKTSYEEDDVIELTDLLAPARYNLSVIVKKTRIPQKRSNRFSSPKIEKPLLLVNNKEIRIELCQTEYINSIIYKDVNGQKLKVFDTLENKSSIFIDTDIVSGERYKYYLAPYYLDSASGKKYFGEEIELDTIKTPSSTLGEKWWDDDL